VSVLSSVTVLRLVDSVAVFLSHAYQLARVRLASAASPVLRLLVQRDLSPVPASPEHGAGRLPGHRLKRSRGAGSGASSPAGRLQRALSPRQREEVQKMLWAMIRVLIHQPVAFDSG